MSKEKERNELHKTIWNIATELRGAIDGWDFKQYVLGLLFYCNFTTIVLVCLGCDIYNVYATI